LLSWVFFVIFLNCPRWRMGKYFEVG
jgi:hypothetical protein